MHYPRISITHSLIELGSSLLSLITHHLTRFEVEHVLHKKITDPCRCLSTTRNHEEIHIVYKQADKITHSQTDKQVTYVFNWAITHRQTDVQTKKITYVFNRVITHAQTNRQTNKRVTYVFNRVITNRQTYKQTNHVRL